MRKTVDWLEVFEWADLLLALVNVGRGLATGDAVFALGSMAVLFVVVGLLAELRGDNVVIRRTYAQPNN